MQKCGYCGRENETNAQHCAECGTELAVAEVARRPRLHRPLLLLFLASFAIFIAATVLEGVFRWSNPLDGALSALIQSIFTVFFWLMFILPLSLLAHFICRHRRAWRRHTLAVLAPSFLCVLVVLVGLIVNPPTARNRFHSFTGVHLPKCVTNLQTHFEGGGIADYSDIYFFRCSAAETERLILELHLAPTPEPGIDAPPSLGWPDPSKWSQKMVYRHKRDAWFFYLITDATREQVYLHVGCF